MDLFDKDDDGFPIEAAKKLVEMHDTYYPTLKNNMYPFNHIKVAAYHGKTFIKKPGQGLSPSKANILKSFGFDVEYSLEDNEWTISWK